MVMMVEVAVAVTATRLEKVVEKVGQTGLVRDRRRTGTYRTS